MIITCLERMESSFESIEIFPLKPLTAKSSVKGNLLSFQVIPVEIPGQLGNTIPESALLRVCATRLDRSRSAQQILQMLLRDHQKRAPYLPIVIEFLLEDQITEVQIVADNLCH